MKKLIGTLAFSLSLLTTCLQSIIAQTKFDQAKDETFKWAARTATQEVLDKSPLFKLIGDRSAKVAGVTLFSTKGKAVILSTNEAACVMGDFIAKAIDSGMPDNAPKELLTLFVREKLISGTHYLLGDKAGFSLPQWVQNSGTCLAVLNIGERVLGNMAAEALVGGSEKTT